MISKISSHPSIETNDDYIFEFINKYLEPLPYDVIHTVLELVSPNHLVPFLSAYHLPILRQYIISEYFNDDVYLCLGQYSFGTQTDRDFEEDEDENVRLQVPTNDNKWNPLVLNYYYEFETNFFKSDKDGFKLSKKFMSFYEKTLINDLLSHKELRFKFVEITCGVKELIDLLSNTNSRSIITSSNKIRLVLTDLEGFKTGDVKVSYKRLRNKFKVNIHIFKNNLKWLTNLEEIHFCKEILSDVSNVLVNDNLRTLIISSRFKFPIYEFKLPKHLERFSIRNSELKDSDFLKIKLLESLTHLNIDHCPLDISCILCVILNNLPHLKYLKIKYCRSVLSPNQRKIYEDKLIQQSSSKLMWPKNLKVIYSDALLLWTHRSILRKVKWPPNLKRLSLRFLKGLQTSLLVFPQTLTDLDLRFYPYYSVWFKPITLRIPRNLLKLVLIGYDFDNIIIKFPQTLIELNLTKCKRIPFEVIKFPLLLKYLTVDDCEFSYPNEYKHWKDLNKLTYLSLMKNYIVSLSDWIPPPSLIHLFLSGNRIPNMSNDTLIFGENSSILLPHLIGLYMYGNHFTSYKNDTHLPNNVDPSTIFSKCRY
ncbi:hypothetical protein DFJ63DRAFT_247916 [Scheffersomyces coipomensis]|uniref:uncharacterized protein n=1 Tax=Scheffersomyces coipomensis TaxID=1788519 RepID=UPI00315D1A6A